MDNLAKVVEQAFQITKTLATETEFTQAQIDQIIIAQEKIITQLSENQGRLQAIGMHAREGMDLSRTAKDRLADAVTISQDINRVEFVALQLDRFSQEQLAKLVGYLQPGRKRKLWELLSANQEG